MKAQLIFFASLLISVSINAQEIAIELFQDGFNRPLNIQNAGDNRLFVVEQGGQIKIIQPEGVVNSIPFLDISNKISNGNERGLLGLAFHPDYSNNGYFFVNYTNTNGNTQISRFSVDPTNPDLADSASELLTLGFPQPFANHNGGALEFGPDGYLYISSGDGGGGGDPNNNAQNLNVLLGKLLRIDVDIFSEGNNYTIPPNNPFVSNPNARAEIWAYGLRNPWRFSFDEIENHLWIADVGQGNIEEINRQSIDERGLNYGWRCYEGTLPFNTTNCPSQSEITFPFAEYNHSDGNCSITGGYVYRGSQYSDITGLYFFADFCSGKIGTVDNDGNLVNYGNFPGMWVSFGQDMQKELYIVDIDAGKVFKIKGGQVAGNEDFRLNISFRLAPNPSSEHVSLFLTQGRIQEIQIFDVRGRTIYQDANLSSNKIQISTSNYKSGIYFVKALSTEGHSMTKKLIIQ